MQNEKTLLQPLPDIVEDLRAFIRDSGMTQSAVAGACGLNQSQVSRILDGRCSTASKGLKALCVYASVDIHRDASYDPAQDASLMGALRTAVANSTARARQIERLMLVLADR